MVSSATKINAFLSTMFGAVLLIIRRSLQLFSCIKFKASHTDEKPEQLKARLRASLSAG